MVHLARLAMLFLPAILANACLAQLAPPPLPNIDRTAVLAPPPPIAFSQWREVDENDQSTEYVETFPSAFTTPYPANDVVPLRVLLPANPVGPVPVVLITHYWGAKDLRAELSLAKELNEQGIAAAILTLPYHLARTPKGFASGELAIRPDPGSLRATMYQAELDIRRSFDFLDSRKEFKHDGYGLVGTSLGAIVASLGYALDPRAKYAAFLLGGGDLAKILWTSSRVEPVRNFLRNRGWTEDKLRQELAPIEPLNYLPRKEPGQALVIYGRYDTVVVNEATRELIDRLGKPDVVTLDTGHYGGLFAERKVLSTVCGYFQAKFSGKPYKPPAKVVAPTIRVGALLASPQGLDIGVGLDIVHFDRSASAFGTIFATPRNVDLFFGKEIVRGFSIGILGSKRGPGVAFVWSTVL
jgi:dienelactone hydrolase